MKIVLIIFIFLSYIYGETSMDKDNTKKNIQKQIEKEKKYAKEQTFYMGSQYNLKDAEVDEKSLKDIPKQPDYNDEFDMDAVYD